MVRSRASTKCLAIQIPSVLVSMIVHDSMIHDCLGIKCLGIKVLIVWASNYLVSQNQSTYCLNVQVPNVSESKCLGKTRLKIKEQFSNLITLIVTILYTRDGRRLRI